MKPRLQVSREHTQGISAFPTITLHPDVLLVAPEFAYR